MERGTPVININLDPSSNHIVNTEYFLAMKGKEAFVELDRIACGNGD
jgi:hypothetical protein